MSGKADIMTDKNNDGTKSKERKRQLMMTVMEAYELFQINHDGTFSIKKSKFTELRPKNVLLSSKMPHNVCACKYHGNIILLLEALHRPCPSVPLYSRNIFLRMCACDPENETCMSNKCQNCSGCQLFLKSFSSIRNNENKLHWYRWDTDQSNYITKIAVEGTVKDAMIEHQAQLPAFLWHALFCL